MLNYLYLISGIIIYEYIKYINNNDNHKINRHKIQLKNNKLKFNLHNDFFFGVATSSHQNEGFNKNNWTDWEDKNNLEKSNYACGQWLYFDKDIENMKFLGVNSYRFSIEWSRIFPEEDKIDYEALNKYKSWCIKLRKNNIEPFVTLHHFTRPIWVDEKYGGLHNIEIEGCFLKYVDLVSKYLKKEVKYWITFNEPFLELVHGYIRGTRPPGIQSDLDKFKNALINICDIHSKSYNIIHKHIPKAFVSIAKNVTHMISYHDYDPVKSYFAEEVDRFYNRQLIDALTTGEISCGFNFFGNNFGIHENKKLWKNKLDYIGLNHYNIAYVKIDYISKNFIDVVLTKDKTEFEQNDLGWDLCHFSMYEVLKTLGKYNLPIIITENGTCDNSAMKSKQIALLSDHIACIEKAMSEGVDVRGFFYWTLNDNFEWDDGYHPKFGLFKTNFKMLKEQIENNSPINISTTPNISAKFYKKLIKEHLLPLPNRKKMNVRMRIKKLNKKYTIV
jgi:beta-glucosidase